MAIKNFEALHIRTQIAQKVDENQSSRLALAGGFSSLPENEVIVFPQDQRNESFVYRPEDLPNNVRLRTVDAVVGMAIIDHRQQLTNYKENFQYQRGYDAVRDIPEYSVIEVQRKTDDTDWGSITAHVYEIQTYLAPAAKELASDDYINPTIALPIPPMLGLDYRPFSMVDTIPTRDVFADDERTANKKKQSRDDGQASDNGEDPFGSGNQDDSGSSDEEGEKPETKSEDEAEAEEVIPVRLVRFYDLQTKEVGKTYYYRVRVWVKDPNNPDAVNADIAGSISEGSKRGGIGIGGGLGGGNQADGGGNNSNKGKKRAPKVKKPLAEMDLSGEVRKRLAEDPEIPVDIARDATNDDLKEQREALRKAFEFSRPTEWVEAAQPVTITSGFETFVGGPVASPPAVRIGQGVFTVTEPSVNVVANSFESDLDVFVPAQVNTLRGSLLNFNAVTNLLDPLTWAIREVFASEDDRGNKQGRRFRTNAMVLDIMGGNRLGRGNNAFSAPGECLIMDRNGRIHLHNDITDATAWRHANFVSESNTEAMDDASGKKKRDDDNNDDMGGNRGRGR